MYAACAAYGLLIVEDDPYFFLTYPRGPGARAVHAVHAVLAVPAALAHLVAVPPSASAAHNPGLPPALAPPSPLAQARCPACTACAAPARI